MGMRLGPISTLRLVSDGKALFPWFMLRKDSRVSIFISIALSNIPGSINAARHLLVECTVVMIFTQFAMSSLFCISILSAATSDSSKSGAGASDLAYLPSSRV